jgi:predicted metal-binding membrane protein
VGEGQPRLGALAPVVGLLVAVALGSAVVLSLPAVAGSLGHERPIAGASGLTTLALFLVAWTLMMLAMMLPSSSALLAAVGRLAADRRRAAGLQLATSASYLAIWLAIGYLFRAGEMAAHTVLGHLAWVEAHEGAVGASVLLLAGAFQFTDLKRRCLTACRTPTSFVYRYWRGGNPAADAARIGTAYGLSCVGCCWALMLVMFAFGVTSALGMLAFGAVMAVEKTTRWGRYLTIPLGVTLLAAGIVALVRAFSTST